jgi:hypothetical protein
VAKRIVRYIAVMEGEDGRAGSSRPVLLASDPETVKQVVRLIGDRMGWEPAPSPETPPTSQGEA